MAGRITTRPVQVDGFTIPAGQRTGLLFAAANRDPRAWEHPEAFDVDRDVRRAPVRGGHVIVLLGQNGIPFFALWRKLRRPMTRD
jgi:cytochrome P450